MRLLMLAAVAIVGCASTPIHEVVTDLHYEPDKGCGSGYVMTVCRDRTDGWHAQCWTGDVRDWGEKW